MDRSENSILYPTEAQSGEGINTVKCFDIIQDMLLEIFFFELLMNVGATVNGALRVSNPVVQCQIRNLDYIY